METVQPVDPLRVCPRGCLLLASDRFCPWHGLPVQSFVGRTVGNYVVKRPLSDGGFGAVYLAANTTKPEFVVAMKLLKPPLCYSQDTVDFFLKEAVATKGVTSVNIPVIHDLHRTPWPYITMELVDGVSLQDLMTTQPTNGTQAGKKPALSSEQALCILRGIARALAASHEKDVIHRDLKPHNVMIRSDATIPLEDRVQVIDWGISLSLQKRQSDSSSGRHPTKAGRRRERRGDVVGTFPYMASEAFDGRYYPQTDVYAFGVLACELLTGQKPYSVPSEADAARWRAVHESGDASKLPLSNGDVPARVQRVISRCLAADHSQRYRDGRVLLKALENRRRRWPAAVAAGLLVLIFVALAFLRGAATLPLGATKLFDPPEWPVEHLPPTWPSVQQGRGSESRVDFYDLRALSNPTVFRTLTDPRFQTRLGLGGGTKLARVSFEQETEPKNELPGATRTLRCNGDSIEWTNLIAIVGQWVQGCILARRPTNELRFRLRAKLEGLLGGWVAGTLVFHWDAESPVFESVQLRPHPKERLPDTACVMLTGVAEHCVPEQFRLDVVGDDEHSPLADVEVRCEGSGGPVEVKVVSSLRTSRGALGYRLVTELSVDDQRGNGHPEWMTVVLRDAAGNETEHPTRLYPELYPRLVVLVSDRVTADGKYEFAFRTVGGREPPREYFKAHVTSFEPTSVQTLSPEPLVECDLDSTEDGLHRLRIPLDEEEEQWVTVLTDEGTLTAGGPKCAFGTPKCVNRSGSGESGVGEGSR